MKLFENQDTILPLTSKAGSPIPSKIEVSPLVSFSILDHYSRREEDANKVIGALLGERKSDGRICVTGSFPVPHEESGQVCSLHTEFFERMYKLHKRVSAKENVVGWYAASEEQALSLNSQFFHEFFEKACEAPVHLMMDPSLSTQPSSPSAQHIPTLGFANKKLSLGSKVVGSQFVPVEVVLADPEGLVDMLFRRSTPAFHDKFQQTMSPAFSEYEGLELSLNNILSFLDKVALYVQDVQDGKVTSTPEIQEALSDALSCVPSVDVDGFKDVIGKSINELKMVLQLSSLTQHQLDVGEQLAMIKDPVRV